MGKRIGKDKLTPRQLKLIRGVVAGKTIKVAALDAGYGGSDESARVRASIDLHKDSVSLALHRALDRAGATLDKTAKVVADAMDAGRNAVDKFGEIVDLGPDHKTRLAAAELGGRFRHLLAPKVEDSGTAMAIGFFLLKGRQERGLPPIDAEPA